MEKWKSMIYGVTAAAFLCGTVLCTSHIASHAAGDNLTTDKTPTFGEVYSTAVEAAYGDTFRSVYENCLAGSPLESECPDGVDTATGHLIITRSDLSLEGTGGMDFELNRYYDSNEANLGHATVEYTKKLEVDTVWVNYTAADGKQRRIIVNAALLKNHKKALKNLLVKYEKGEGRRGMSLDGKPDYEEKTQRTKIVSNESHNVYGIASGWRYDFPWIETVTLAEKEGWEKRPAYLHYGSAGVIPIETEQDEAGRRYPIQGLENYSYEDIKLEDWDKTVDGIACKYLLRDKTGLRTYFNENGVIVLQKDAHDNTIRYTYTDGIYFSKITDAVGREIEFHYSGEEDERILASVTVEGTKTESGGVAKKTITYETEEKSYTPYYGDRLHGVILTGATVDGSKEKYGYKTVERLVNTSGAGVASQRVSTNQSYLLNKITADGSETCYEYRAGSLRGSREEKSGQKRDVVTEQFYVTREYEKDTRTGKKSNGVKYDYFQKKGNGGLRSYDDFREREDKKDGSAGTIYETWQYGNSGLRTVTVVSSFNPNKYKTNGKYYDYTYKKSNINADTLKLKKNTKKNVTLYLYNENKLLTEEVSYGTEKEETLYSYDKNGKGSLVVQETEKSFGSKANGTKTIKQGYVYDNYRNVLIEKSPKAYLKKNSAKQNLFTTTYAYNTGSGYPAEDKPYSLCSVSTQEFYTSANMKSRLVSEVDMGGVDYRSISEQRSINGGVYKTISKTDFKYDAAGNEIQGKVYPSYVTDGKKECVQNDYNYNSLGQQTKKTVTLVSAKNLSYNRTYTEKEATYDTFGNELTYTNENGLVSRMSYDSETGEEVETVNAVGTEYESKDKEYISSDTLKTMTLDEYGRASIDIRDGFGNTIICKDEAAGKWTESTYEYGTEESGSEEGDDKEDIDTETGKIARLLEEKTYTFEPGEKKFIVNEDGEMIPNFYITGRGNDILSGTKYFYDNLGNMIGSAEFSNGEFNAAHCTAWTFEKEESEIIGEEDEAKMILTSYSKELAPSKYQEDINTENYYDQFNDAVLTETITRTITDTEGNTLSETETVICEGNRSEMVTIYEADDFGRVVKESKVSKKYQDGKWLPAYEMEILYSYGEDGNISQTVIKSRKEGEANWQSKIIKADYNAQGQLIKEYAPRGIKEGVAAKYEYDILGRKVKDEMPQEKKDGSVSYQTIVTEYDDAGNITAKEEQIDSGRTARTEYTYDKRGRLVMVKNCMEDGKAQYVQYVYDVQGNKVRQFTGMTSPLTLTVMELTDDGKDTDVNGKDERDVFYYAGKTYCVEVSGKKKSDDIRETKYEYNGKNQLVAYTDPEGRKEIYTYDVNSNLTKIVDKNGNTQKNTYDYQNRLTEMVSAPSKKKTGKETKHTYTYNAYGEVATQDDTTFVYDNVSGQITKETTKLTPNKDVVKNYTYDSVGNKSAFAVRVGDDIKLSLQYTYDGESKLISVTDEKGSQIVGYSYDMDGNLAERTVTANSLKTTYTYDYQNRLTTMKNQTDSGIISGYKSEYLLNGQKSKENSDIVDKDGKKFTKTATYTYDLLGRITKETKTGNEDVSYMYDSNNNRKEMKAGNKVTAYKYNKNDELLRTDTLNTDTEEDSVVIYKNDKNGNQLATVNRYEIPNEKKNDTYVDIDVTLGDNRLNKNVVNHYNTLNQLTQTLTKNYKVNFTYDAEGLRTSKTVNGEKQFFVWDGDQLVMELSGSGKLQKRYVRGNDLVYADKGTGTEKRFYVTDLHGNVVQLTDEAGKVVKVYEYDSFGNEVNPDRKDDNPFRYCGEYYDKEMEEIYLRARYYQPAVGRFLTSDTYVGEADDPLSLHLYTYCDNDGINQIDPSGHWGKTQYGAFVHQDITETALNQYVKEHYIDSINPIVCSFNSGKDNIILDGAILPDFVNDKAKSKSKAKDKYGDSYYNKYKKYTAKVLWETCVKNNKKEKFNAKNVDNIFHGKKRSRLKNLKKQAKKKIRKGRNDKKSLIILGCVLHSIQDYQAHSYVSDLETYKDITKKDKFSQKINAFHMDWNKEVIDIKNKKDKKREQKQRHKRTKDNPNAIFAYNYKTNKWEWRGKFDSKEENPRYTEAINKSAEYLKNLFN